MLWYITMLISNSSIFIYKRSIFHQLCQFTLGSDITQIPASVGPVLPGFCVTDFLCDPVSFVSTAAQQNPMVCHFFLPLKLIFLVTSPVFDGHISHIHMVVPSAWSCLAWKTHGWPDMSTVSEWISSGSRWFSWENLQETMVLTLKCGSQECFLLPSSMSGTKLLISRRWSQSPFQSVDLPWWFLCGSWSSFMGHIDMFVGLSGTPKSHDSSSFSLKLLQIRYQLFLSISGKT